MASSQQCSNPRRKFTKRERLSHVIVGTKIEALHPVFHPVSAGQDKYGHARLARPQMTQDRDSVHTWQVQIQHEQVVIQFAGHGFRLLAIMGHVHGIMFRFETFLNKGRKSRIVFGN